MPERVYADRASLYKNYRTANERLEQAMHQLSTGRQLVRPGDEPVAYDKVVAMGVDRNSEIAQLQALQGRLSWFQTSVSYLTSIREMLTEMSAAAIQAASPTTAPKDRSILDATFQSYKSEISQIVDGHAGREGPSATFNGLPLLIGYAPDVEVGVDVPPGKLLQQQLGLYTGFGNEGFDSLPLIDAAGVEAVASHSGTAVAGTSTTVTLGAGASAIEDGYVGMTLTIVGGTGAGQSMTIAGYDPVTREVTFSAPLGTAPDVSSLYRIDALEANRTLEVLPGMTSLHFASWAWGADNDRAVDQQSSFRSLTPEEEVYRLANSVPETDLEAKTYQERLARRQRNIFDSEYGNLNSEQNVQRMQVALAGAIDQISGLITDHAARAESIQQQALAREGHREVLEQGIDSFEKVDAVKTSALLSTINVDPSRIMELAARLADNIGKLNDLVRSGGVRR